MLQALIHLISLKKDFIALKAEVGKLDVNKLVNAPTSLNYFKTVPVDLKRLSDVLDNEVIKNTRFNKLNTKVNDLEKEILDATTLIHIN